MNDYRKVLAFAALPAAGNFLGGLVASVAELRVTAVVEEIVPEAHEEKDSRFAAMAPVGGFALFTRVSIYFE